MGSLETLCLYWNKYESNIKQGFSTIRNNEEFFDVTLACGSKQIRAHRVILSACSSFFRSHLKSIPHQDPFLFLRGIQPQHLEAILGFIYNGEVRVPSEDLDEFLACAQELKINGLITDDAAGPLIPKAEPGVKREHEPQGDSLPHKRPHYQEDDDEVKEVLPSGAPQNDPQMPVRVQPEPTREEPEQTPETSNNEVSVNEQLDEELKKYVSDRDQNGIFKCLKCSYSSRMKRDVMKHVEARHFVTDGFDCDRCSRVFKTRESLSKHFKKVHKGESVYFSTSSEKRA
eukprot:TRINITY_DN1175_c0_g2_i1.p1 TRINITY_DN1175_c0_g2~~TRINITY_DN1175_c0_g2_i1.p1  ORF type:complete len:287 (+),score=79.16 TRINITY_DN1175_c0_g2_i1:91-951(+)